MKRFCLLIFFTTTLLSCTKQSNSADCNLVGTWEEEDLGIRMILSQNGDMVYGGFSGFFWHTKDNCSIFEYWAKTDKSASFQFGLKIHDENHITLDGTGTIVGIILGDINMTRIH